MMKRLSTIIIILILITACGASRDELGILYEAELDVTQEHASIGTMSSLHEAIAERHRNETLANKHLGSSELGIGGDEFNYEFYLPFDAIYYGIPAAFVEHVGDDNFYDWLKSIGSILPDGRRNPNSDGLQSNIRDFIRYFNLTIEEVRLLHPNVIIYDFQLGFTDEMVDALFSNDVAELHREFNNPFAIYHNGTVYTPSWISSHSFDDFMEEGIPVELILDMVDTAIEHGRFVMQMERVAEMINEALENTAQVTTTAATNIASSAATLNAAIANNSGTIGYGFYWGTTNNPSNRVSVGVADAASLNFTFDLEGLAPNTTYFFRAFAGASRGEVVSFRTEEPEPLPIPYELRLDGSYWHWGWGYHVYHDFRNEDILIVRAFFVDDEGHEIYIPGVEIEYSLYGDAFVQNTTGEFSTWDIGRDGANVVARAYHNGVLFSAEAPIYVVRVPLR